MKTPLALMLWLTALLAGCAVPPGNRADRPTQPVAQILVHVGAGRRIETVPSANGSCDTQQIVYVDESKGVRQVIVDWSALSERFSYTLSSEGRADLIARIQDRGKGCTLIQNQKIDSTRLDTNQRRQAYSFVRYWLQGHTIHLQAVQLDARPDTSGAMQFRSEQFDFDEWSDLRTENWGNKPYRGPVAKPQVAYRIDEHRFFEVVPRQKFACARARLYYNDTAKGIRANIAPWDNVKDEGIFIIDASSEQYLVAPMIDSSSGCQAGGGDLCAGSLYFSQDSGRTWIRDMPLSGANYLTRNTVYPLHRNRPGDISSSDKARLDLVIPQGPHTLFMPGGWIKRIPILKRTPFFQEQIPLPKKFPIDSRLHCN